MKPLKTLATIALLGVVLAAGGCSQDYYAKDADQQVYGLLQETHHEEFGRDRPFTIDDSPSRNAKLSMDEILGDLPAAEPFPEWLAESTMAKLKEPIREIDLAAALRLARRNSRDFQSNKETVYAAALALTTQLHSFENVYGLTGGANRSESGTSPNRNKTVNGNGDFNVTRDLITGAAIALDIGLTGVKYLNHGLGDTLQSAINLSGSQPLWRGADRTVVLNNLTQARNNLVYALRNFSRYEKGFAIGVAENYYSVLLSMDTVKNQWNNYKNLIVARKRNEAMANAGRLQKLEVEQARQSELSAHNSYLVAVQGYESALDAYRVQLGLPTDAPVVLSRQPLDDLAAGQMMLLDCESDSTVRVALARRLDLKNSRGAIQDADRQVIVAADALKGDLSLVGQMNVPSDPPTHAARFMFHEGLYQYGVQVSLPLDRLAQRNSLRAAIISDDVSIRSYMDLVDSIKTQVRNSLRQLQRTEATYEIQKASVELAQRRVAGTTLQLRAGRALTRDLLDAQDALVNAENALSEALVAHQNAKFELLKDLELLEVDEQGQIREGNLYEVLKCAPPSAATEKDAVPAEEPAQKSNEKPTEDQTHEPY